MTTTNTATRYGSVTKTFHWLTVLLIAALIPLGVIASGAPYDTGEELARKAWLFSMHKTLGVTLFFVALARIGWAISQPKPNLLNGAKKSEAFLAEMVHWLLYGSLLIVPLSGWIHHASTTGFAPIWWPFGQNLPLVPKSETLADITRGLHIVFERVLVVSIALHIAGALKHHFIDKDVTLLRMLPGKTEGAGHDSAHTALPFVAALVVWAAALTVGSTLGIYSGHQTAGSAGVDTPALEQGASQWQVQTGTLEIDVTQFGSVVTGSFAEWTAQIAYEPSDIPGPQGTALVEIALGSLTLGSVTDQAMGPDFFNIAEHPTAVLEADLVNAADSQVAQGTLTLRGAVVPIEMPFFLRIEDGVATANGKITLDRRSFGIGDNMSDESSLNFGVTVRFALTATRSAD